MLQGVNGGDDDLVAAAVGERQAVAFEAGARVQHDVGGGVVAEIEGVGAVLVQRRGKPDVADGEVRDLHRVAAGRPQVGSSWRHVLVHGNGVEATDGVGVHHRHHVHRPARTEELLDLREGGRVHLLVAQHLTAEADHGGVLLVEPGERAARADDVDDLGVDAGFQRARLVPVPLQAVIGFAARHHDGELAHVRVERSGDGGVMEIEQRFGHAGVVGRERERAAEDAVLRPAWQHVKNLLGVLVEVLALQIGQASAGLRIEIRGQWGRRLRGGKKNSGGQQQGCAPIQTSASKHGGVS